MPRVVALHDETMRLVRKPLILALKRAAACKDCHPDIFVEWRLHQLRLIELHVKMIPCFVHSVEITAAMHVVEKKVVRK
ncbi:MAG: hypothetical protein OK436_07230 [Thaumarchaeota archaeon]|nr:hypothetical protein [Nitrososphaerota archaeon]